MKRLLAVLSIIAFAWAVPASAGGGTYYDVPVNDLTVRIYTDNDQPDGRLKTFQVSTAYGDMRGDLFDDGYGKVTLAVTNDRESALITWEDTGFGALNVRVDYSGHGTIHAVIYEDESWVVVENTLTDCASLFNSALYNAVTEINVQFQWVLADLDPTSPGVTDGAVGEAFYRAIAAIRAMPAFAGCDDENEVTNPFWLCVLLPTWGECMTCCVNDGVLENMADIFLYVSGPFAAVAVFAQLMAPNSCNILNCPGKPGDPNPTSCGVGGVCAAACAQQNPVAGTCPQGLHCCGI